MSKHIVNATDATFRAEVLESAVPVLVDFWAPWCGPCKAVAPVIEQLAAEYASTFKIVKLNTDDNPATAAEYGIMSIPTLAIFRGGTVVDGILGAAPKPLLKALLEKHVQPTLAT